MILVTTIIQNISSVGLIMNYKCKKKNYFFSSSLTILGFCGGLSYAEYENVRAEESIKWQLCTGNLCATMCSAVKCKTCQFIELQQTFVMCNTA